MHFNRTKLNHWYCCGLVLAGILYIVTAGFNTVNLTRINPFNCVLWLHIYRFIYTRLLVCWYIDTVVRWCTGATGSVNSWYFGPPVRWNHGNPCTTVRWYTGTLVRRYALIQPYAGTMVRWYEDTTQIRRYPSTLARSTTYVPMVHWYDGMPAVCSDASNSLSNNLVHNPQLMLMIFDTKYTPIVLQQKR